MARPSTMPSGTEQKLIELVARGLTDVEIGRQLGRKRSTITSWRARFCIRRVFRGDCSSRFSLTNY